MKKVWLIGRTGTYAYAKIEVEEAIVIGRDSKVCQLVFSSKDIKISGVHCKIENKGGDGYISDMNSTNGTFMDDGTRLPPNVPRRIMNGQGFYLAGNREYSFGVEETEEQLHIPGEQINNKLQQYVQPEARDSNWAPVTVKEKKRTSYWAIAVIIVLLIAGSILGYAYYQEKNKTFLDKGIEALDNPGTAIQDIFEFIN